MPSCALPVLIAALLVGACGPPAEVIAMRTSQAEHRARQAYEHDPALRVRAERGIVFEYGACIRYTFDSARRMFVRDQGYSVDEARPREVLRRRDSTRVAWTDADLQAVLADAHRTGLWGYPSDFGDSLSRARHGVLHDEDAQLPLPRRRARRRADGARAVGRGHRAAALARGGAAARVRRAARGAPGGDARGPGPPAGERVLPVTGPTSVPVNQRGGRRAGRRAHRYDTGTGVYLGDVRTKRPRVYT